MSVKQVIPRARATRDAEEAVDWSVSQGASEAALDLVRALERAFRHLSRHPASGSPRIGIELGLAALRSWRVEDFPYLIFYVERDDHLDVWRILHGQRDLPAWLGAPDEP